MSNSPLIRTAVNLWLIAAMVIQPMAIVAAQGNCAQGVSAGTCCQAKTLCQSCKSCKVETDGDLCGCCSGGKDEPGSCCGNTDASEPRNDSSKPTNDELFGEGSDIVPELTGAGDELAEGKASVSSCKCGIRSEPIAPSPHRVPAPQVRELIVIAYLDHAASEAGLSVRPNDVRSRLPIGDLSPHFSQRFLCIWRI